MIDPPLVKLQVVVYYYSVSADRNETFCIPLHIETDTYLGNFGLKINRVLRVQFCAKINYIINFKSNV